MPFTIRPFVRFAVSFPLTYHVGYFQGRGTVWNLSSSGCRLSGDLPLRLGEICSLTVPLPHRRRIYVVAAIVRWRRDDEYGVETVVMDHESKEDLDDYLAERIENG